MFLNISFFNETNRSIGDIIKSFIGSLTTYPRNLRKIFLGLRNVFLCSTFLEHTLIQWENVWVRYEVEMNQTDML